MLAKVGLPQRTSFTALTYECLEYEALPPPHSL